jgi:hypothetical protein
MGKQHTHAETAIALSIETDDDGIHVTVHDGDMDGPVIAEQAFASGDDSLRQAWFLDLVVALKDRASRVASAEVAS